MRTIGRIDRIGIEDKRVLVRIKNVIHAVLPTATALLYGSMARGTHDPESDYDILVITEDPVAPEAEDKIDAALFDIELTLGRAICATYYPRTLWNSPQYRAMPFHIEVDKDSVEL